MGPAILPLKLTFAWKSTIPILKEVGSLILSGTPIEKRINPSEKSLKDMQNITCDIKFSKTSHSDLLRSHLRSISIHHENSNKHKFRPCSARVQCLFDKLLINKIVHARRI